jgi:large subunit ribosomal protein L25
MGDASLTIEIRTEGGKGVARRLRRDGRIPGVLYGSELAATSISLDPAELNELIRTSHAGVNTLIDLTGASEVAGRTVLVKELQRSPVRGDLIHADLYEVDPNARIRVSVPIHLRGTAEGVTMGGLIDHSLRVVELDCLPRAIPDEILVDVSDLDIGDSVHVSDLALPEGVELVTHGELSVVSVVAPKAEEEPTVDEELAEGLEGEAAEGEGEGEGADAAPAPEADAKGESKES